MAHPENSPDIPSTRFPPASEPVDISAVDVLTEKITKRAGPLLGFIGGITFFGIAAVQFARSDVAVVSILVIVIVAVASAVYARRKNLH